MLLAARLFVLLKKTLRWNVAGLWWNVICTICSSSVSVSWSFPSCFYFSLFLLLIPSFPWLCFGALFFWDYPFSEMFSTELPSSHCCSSSFSSNSRTFFFKLPFLLFYLQLSRVLQHNKQPMQNTDRGLNHKNAETLNVSEAQEWKDNKCKGSYADKKMSKTVETSELTLSEQKEDCNKEETYYTLT